MIIIHFIAGFYTKSLPTTQGIFAEAKTVLVIQLGYIASVSILSKNLFVIAEASPTPRELPWDSSLRSRKHVLCTLRPPVA